jgi:hypothetical protein
MGRRERGTWSEEGSHVPRRGAQMSKGERRGPAREGDGQWWKGSGGREWGEGGRGGGGGKRGG